MRILTENTLMFLFEILMGFLIEKPTSSMDQGLNVERRRKYE